MHIVESTSKCRYDAWSCVYVYIGGGGGLLFFRIHVKGVIEFFCDIIFYFSFWPSEMISQEIGPSDVAGVTRVCNNLQFVFTSTPQWTNSGMRKASW
jgi:hypothetical protein